MAEYENRIHKNHKKLESEMESVGSFKRFYLEI